MFRFRPLTANDIPRLTEINPTFSADSVIQVARVGQAPWQGWHLQEVPLAHPFHKGDAYDFDAIERDNIAQRLGAGDGLLEVVEQAATGRLVGCLDVEWEHWRRSAWIWNAMLDVSVRRQGLGRQMIERTIQWARAKELRAIFLETQSNNPPACHFYARLGFQLVGVNDLFYTNHDLANQEVALFWALTLT
jgi:RimJ/RimL family protein N-acetyltransferase